MSDRLEGKVAIVTGGGSGIGEAACQAFAAEGARIMIGDINSEAATRVAQSIGSQARSVELDAGDPASIESLIQATIEAFGRIDILHNNAAITSADFISRDGAIADLDLDIWSKTLDVNLRGYALGCKAALPHMIAGGGGAIINTSSNAALHGDLARSAYAASKGAINTLTLYVAAQHGRQGVRCNAICPGFIMTPAVENSFPGAGEAFSKHVLAPRHGRPEDVAALACFLAGDDASFITGQIISVDGGFRAKSSRVADVLGGFNDA